MLDDATAAEGVETFDDGGGVDVVASAEHADEVRVDVAEQSPGGGDAGHRLCGLRQGARVARAPRRHHGGGGRAGRRGGGEAGVGGPRAGGARSPTPRCLDASVAAV